MTDVFISYSRTNSEFVHWLHDELVGAGTSVWVDWVDIPPASDWEKDIYDNIDAADSVVFVVSAASLASQYCGKELQRAINGGKRLVPIACDAADPANAVPALAQVNWIWCRDVAERSGAIAKLKSALSTDLEWARTHTRLLVRAVEWQTHDEDKSLLLRGHDLGEAEGALAANATKQPAPTELHHRYVGVSRKTATRRQRALLGAVLVALILSIALGVVALFQRAEALNAQLLAQRETVAAKHEASIAQQQRERAIASAKAALAAKSTALAAKSAALAAKAAALAAKSTALAATAAAQRSDTARLSLLLGSISQEQLTDHPDVALIAGLRANELGGSLSTRVSMLADLEQVRALGITGLLEGDTSKIQDLAISPSGAEISAANVNGTVDLWDARTNHLVATLPRHTVSALLATFSPSGRQLAVAYSDGSILLWTLADKHAVTIISAAQAAPELTDGGTTPVTSLAFNQAGTLFAFGARSPTVKIYALGARVRLKYTFTDPFNNNPSDLCEDGTDYDPTQALSVAFRGSGANEQLVLVDSYGGAGWSNAVTWRLGAPTSDYGSVLFSQGAYFLPADPTDAFQDYFVLSPDGRYVADYALGNVDVYSTRPPATPTPACTLATLVTAVPLHGATTSLSTIAFSPNGDQVAVGTSDGALTQWSVQHKDQAAPAINLFDSSVGALAYAPGHHVMVTFNKQGVQVLDTRGTGAYATTTAVDRGAIKAASFGEGFSGNGQVVGTANAATSTVGVWQSPAGATSPLGTFNDGANCSAVAFDQTGAQYVLNCGDLEYFPHLGATPYVWPVPYEDENYVANMAISPNGAYVAAGYNGHWSCEVQLWRTSLNAQSPRTLAPSFDCGLDGTVTTAFSPNGAEVAVAYGIGDVQLWSTRTGKTLAALVNGQLSTIGQASETLEFATNPQVLAFSPNGTELAISYDNGVTVIWDPTTNAQITIASPLTAPVSALAFSRDGQILAMGATNGSVALVQSASGVEIGQPLAEGHGVVNALTFSAGGDTLLAAYTDGTVLAFADVEWPSLAWLRETVCRVVRDPVSKTAWSVNAAGTTYVDACSS